MKVQFLSAALAVISATTLLASTASATPKYNPFTYTYSTLGEGEIELEQYADFIPLRAYQSINSTDTVWYGATQFQTEFEYGITDRLELGLYVSYVPTPSNLSTGALTEGNGIKQRLRLRLADEGAWPIDVALYGEVVENDREIELEAKIILQKRIDRLRALINLWGEREMYFVGEKEWVINPTAALSYQVTPSIFPGIEGWMRAEWSVPGVSPRPFNQGPITYVGPTFSVNFGRFWWTVGAYARLNDWGRTMQAGDTFGTVWIRNIVGLDLQ